MVFLFTFMQTVMNQASFYLPGTGSKLCIPEFFGSPFLSVFLQLDILCLFKILYSDSYSKRSNPFEE